MWDEMLITRFERRGGHPHSDDCKIRRRKKCPLLLLYLTTTLTCHVFTTQKDFPLDRMETTWIQNVATLRISIHAPFFWSCWNKHEQSPASVQGIKCTHLGANHTASRHTNNLCMWRNPDKKLTHLAAMGTLYMTPSPWEQHSKTILSHLSFRGNSL